MRKQHFRLQRAQTLFAKLFVISRRVPPHGILPFLESSSIKSVKNTAESICSTFCARGHLFCLVFVQHSKYWSTLLGPPHQRLLHFSSICDALRNVEKCQEMLSFVEVAVGGGGLWNHLQIQFFSNSLNGSILKVNLLESIFQHFLIVSPIIGQPKPRLRFFFDENWNRSFMSFHWVFGNFLELGWLDWSDIARHLSLKCSISRGTDKNSSVVEPVRP